MGLADPTQLLLAICALLEHQLGAKLAILQIENAISCTHLGNPIPLHKCTRSTWTLMDHDLKKILITMTILTGECVLSFAVCNTDTNINGDNFSVSAEFLMWLFSVQIMEKNLDLTKENTSRKILESQLDLSAK